MHQSASSTVMARWALATALNDNGTAGSLSIYRPLIFLVTTVPRRSWSDRLASDLIDDVMSILERSLFGKDQQSALLLILPPLAMNPLSFRFTPLNRQYHQHEPFSFKGTEGFADSAENETIPMRIDTINLRTWQCCIQFEFDSAICLYGHLAVISSMLFRLRTSRTR